MTDGFKPSDDMLAVLKYARKQLESDSNPIDANPMRWVVACGLPANQWEAWLAQYGKGFEDWFAHKLALTPLEIACIDRAFWSALGRGVSDGSPPAAILKLWSDLMGHSDRKPEAPPTPVLSSSEALEYMIKMGPGILRMVLTESERRENARLGVVDNASS